MKTGVVSGNRKIVIVYVIDFLATREGVTGGTERQLIETLTRLDRSKFRPILFCLQEFKKIPYWEELNCEKYIIDVYSLGSFNSLLSLISFVRFLKRNCVDIVQTFFFDSTLFGILGAKLAGVKNRISCRRDMGFWYDRKLLKKLIFVNLFTKRFLVNSNAIKDSMVKQENVPEEAIDVICNGVDLNAIDKVEPSDLSCEFMEIEKNDKVIGLVANFNRTVKRVDLFVKAAAEVAKQVQNVKFFILGGGKLENELRQLARDWDVEETVIFAGKRYSAIPYIKSFDIGVLTSDSEGFSNVILEYMAAGIPVIATDVGGNRELIENEYTGVLVPQGDYKAIARGICKLLSDKSRRGRMGQEARRVVRENYSWGTKIGEIETYYLSLLKS